MSTPNDNQRLADNIFGPDSDEAKSMRLANYTAKLEKERDDLADALAEEKANQEKIGATVQAAKDSPLTAPIDWQAAASEAANRYYSIKRERDALQAQRDELVKACKKLIQSTVVNGQRFSTMPSCDAFADIDAAIARATEEGKVNES